MPDTSLAQANLAAERMRATVNQTPFALDDKAASISVTVSVGVAVDDHLGPDALPAERLFDLADAALFEAKVGGRNKVATSSRVA